MTRWAYFKEHQRLQEIGDPKPNRICQNHYGHWSATCKPAKCKHVRNLKSEEMNDHGGPVNYEVPKRLALNNVAKTQTANCPEDYSYKI